MPTDTARARLRLLTLAVDAYSDTSDEDTLNDNGLGLGIKDQLRAVHAWWTDPALGERGFTPEHPSALNDRNDIEEFLQPSGLREAPSGDSLVLYITGHGLKGNSSGRFLQLPGTDTQRLLATAYRTSDLVLAAVDSHAADVLVIVNTCHSARILSELAQASEEITLRRRRGARLAVIATADPPRLSRCATWQSCSTPPPSALDHRIHHRPAPEHRRIRHRTRPSRPRPRRHGTRHPD
jgi:hypothetical protein